MRSKWLLFALTVPMVLACGGIPGMPGAETPAEAPPQAPAADAITELEAALDGLSTVLDAAEAADATKLDPARVDAARVTATNARITLDAPVQKVMALGQ